MKVKKSSNRGLIFFFLKNYLYFELKYIIFSYNKVVVFEKMYKI